MAAQRRTISHSPVVLVLALTIFSTLCLSTGVGAVAQDKSKKEPKRVTFIITSHLLLHERKIVTWEEVGKILDEAGEEGLIRPQFLFTNGGVTRDEEVREHRWKLYKRLYDAGKIKGMTIGSISPRTSERFDLYTKQEDLLPDPAKKVFGRILDVNGESLQGVEVFLLPDKHINGVYLRDGKIRNPYDEHMTRSAADGSFVVYPEETETLIVATHPSGFVITSLGDFKKTGHLRLKHWARVQGTRPTKGPDAEQTVYFTCYPVPGISFHIYETSFKPNGSFDQKYIPPGRVNISRAVPIGDGGTRSFVVKQVTLVPGLRHKIDLGPIPDEAKKVLDQ